MRVLCGRRGRSLRKLLPRVLSAWMEGTIATDFLSSNHRYLLPPAASILGAPVMMPRTAPRIVDCRFSDEDQVARSDRRRLVTVAQKRAAMLVDAGPGAFDRPIADDAVDA